MRDVIWTLIFVWLAWKIVNIFRNASPKMASEGGQQAQMEEAGSQPGQSSDRRRKLDTEGEYVDFEEVK